MQHGGPESVDSVMVDGRWLMRGQALLAFDEAAALTEAEAAVAGLQSARQRSWRRWTQRCRRSARALPRNWQQLPGQHFAGTFLVMLSTHHRAMC